MLCVVVVCKFKFMYCVVIVFIMQQLKSIDVLDHPNLNQLDIVVKLFGVVQARKVVIFPPQHNIDTTIPQPDNMLRLSRVVEEMLDTFGVTLKYEPSQMYILRKSCVLGILKGIICWI